MISYLKGKILTKSPLTKKDNFFIIKVNGLGYQVYTTPAILKKIEVGQESEVYTYTSLREDTLELYGFLSFEEIEFFRSLVEVPGIGPKSALNILDSVKPEIIRQAVISDQPDLLVKIGKLSKRTAERIVLGLQSKVKKMLAEAKTIFKTKEDIEIIEALIALGFPPAKAQEALSQVPKEIKDNRKKLQEVLKILGKER